MAANNLRLETFSPTAVAECQTLVSALRSVVASAMFEELPADQRAALMGSLRINEVLTNHIVSQNMMVALCNRC